MLLVIDIGGTNIRYKVLNHQGESIATDRLSSKETNLIKMVEQLIVKYSINSIGISYAGQVSHGTLLSAPNRAIEREDIQNYFEEKYSLNCSIDNDLKCAALAEYDYWKCKSTMVVASIGTGFGAAIVENGQLIRGVDNLAGEIGHMPYRYSPIPCGCGNHYCIEASCSGTALQKYIEYYNFEIEEYPLQALKAMQDSDAQALLDNFHEGLLFAIGTLISLLNPQMIVLGGGVIHKNPYLLEIIKAQISKYALPTALAKVEIIISELEDAPIKGAELLARRREV